MSSKGIFDSGSSESGKTAPSPFGMPADDSDSPPPNPFAAAASQSSPFAVAGDSEADDPVPAEPGMPARLPEKRSAPAGDSPFSLAEPSEGFGMEPSSPFGGGGSSFEAGPSPFAAAPAESPAPAPAGEVGAVPTLKSETPVAEPEKPAAEVKVESKPEPKVEPTAAWSAPEPAPEPAPKPAASAAPELAASAAAPVAAAVGSTVDSTQIRQLELRAIFGVDRELSADEIVQRLQTLAGVRRITRIGPDELGAMDTLRRALAGMANTATPLTLSFGNLPVEFIREGDGVLAVMTDGSFAPGVKETIIIAARELDRMS
jgi:hypothetical protein